MQTSDSSSVLAFLQDCSDSSLADFVLAHAARDRQFSKDLQALLERAVENRARYMLGSLLRQWRKGAPPKTTTGGA